MATETILDRFVTEYAFRSDTRPLDKIERRIRRTQQAISRTSDLLIKGGAAGTGALVGIVATVNRFETEMNALAAATNAGEDDLKRYREQALELGRTTAFSASQAAEAQKLLGQAGLETQDVLAAMPRVLDLAAAGQLSMGEAASIVAANLAGFGIEAQNTDRITDVLSLAATKAKTTVSEMGQSLVDPAAFAKQLGVSIESVAAATAILQNNGIDASRSGTAMRNVFIRLLNITGDSEKAFEEMGISVSDVQDLANQGEWEKIFEMLNTAGISTQQAVRIFGTYTSGAALILGDNISEVRQLADELDNAGGSAERMADTQLKGLPGALLILKSQIEGLTIALGDAGVTAAVIKMTEALGTLIEWVQQADPVIQQIIAAFISISPVALVAGFALRFIGSALLGFIPIINAVIGVWRVLTAAIVAHPLGAFIVALIAVIYYWDEIVAAVETGVEIIKTWLAQLKEPLLNVWQWLTDQWDAVVAYFSAGPEDGQSVISWLWSGVENVWQWLKDQFSALLEFFGVKDETESLISWIWTSYLGIFSWLTDQFVALLEFLGVKDDAESLLSWIWQSYTGIFSWVSDQFDAAVEYLKTGPADDQSVISWIWQTYTGIFSWVSDQFLAVLEFLGVTDAVGSVIDWLWQPVSGIFDWIAEQWNALLTDIVPDFLFDKLGLDKLLINTSSDFLTSPESDSESIIAEKRNALPIFGGQGQPIGGHTQGATITNQRTFNVQELNVDASGGDSQDIAQNVEQALRDQFQTVVEASDSSVMS